MRLNEFRKWEPFRSDKRKTNIPTTIGAFIDSGNKVRVFERDGIFELNFGVEKIG